MNLDVRAEVEIVVVDKRSETSDSSTVSRSSKGVNKQCFIAGNIDTTLKW